MRIAIIGAGISGLAAAYDLQQHDRFDITLFEQSPMVGGKIQTAREGNFLIEQGPDSIFSIKPWAVELMIELGMEPELIEPLGNEFSILCKGKLHPVPRPLAMFAPTEAALARADFLSAAAKRRALGEAEVKPVNAPDESVASFFRRRFGREFSKLVAEPLVAGTHAGDPERLSMAALYPAYLAMERTYGSISKGVAARAAASGRSVGFLTLKHGMARLPDVLSERLTLVKIRRSTAVKSIWWNSDGLTLAAADGSESAFDRLILAVPAFAAAEILTEAAPEAAELLASIRYVSTAIATFAYAEDGFPDGLRGNGFLVPASEPATISGCTWTSNKWAGRAPKGKYLVRVFLGREGGLQVDAHSDHELFEIALDGLKRILRVGGRPILARLDRWPRGLPQYELGHLCRLAEIESALEGLPITLVGSSYRGNSISDCVRQGREAARRLGSGD